MKYSEQEIFDIMFLNSQGKSARSIATLLDKPYVSVLKIVKSNNGTVRMGNYTHIDGTTKREQIYTLWQNGLHNIDMIAKKTATTRSYVKNVFNNYYRIKTRDNSIDIDAEEIARQQLNGENTHGKIAELGRKYKVSKQAAHQRVLVAKKRLQNFEQVATTETKNDFF